MAMTRTQIYLTEEQHGWILRLAKAQRKTMAEVIREAVEEYVIKQMDTEDLGETSVSSADPLRDIIGLGASGITDGSIHHDRYIYDEDFRISPSWIVPASPGYVNIQTVRSLLSTTTSSGWDSHSSRVKLTATA